MRGGFNKEYWLRQGLVLGFAWWVPRSFVSWWVADFAMLVMLKGALARTWAGLLISELSLSQASAAATSQLLFTTGPRPPGYAGREFQSDSRGSYWYVI